MKGERGEERRMGKGNERLREEDDRLKKESFNRYHPILYTKIVSLDLC